MVHEVRIHHPANIALVPNSATTREAIASAMDRLKLDRDDLTVLRARAILEGVAPGKDPSEYRFGFRSTGAARTSGERSAGLQYFDIEAGRVVELAYEADFELLDGTGKVRTDKGRAPLRY